MMSIMKPKIILCWSSGKDSAFALHQLRTSGQYDVVSLLTTLTEGYDRISMHGVRRELVLRQAASLGLPLREVWIPQGSSNETYESRMAEALREFIAAGVTGVAFGDIFLEDLKKYRQDKLATVGLEAIFPIWKRDTAAMAREFIAQGFRAILTCVDTRVLDGRFAGRDFDASLLAELPPNIDPCGENGEFHSFVHAGPVFSRPLAVTKGEIVLRDGWYNFCDVLPA